jgi:hypothetical protein
MAWPAKELLGCSAKRSRMSEAAHGGRRDGTGRAKDSPKSWREHGLRMLGSDDESRSDKLLQVEVTKQRHKTGPTLFLLFSR